ncbi:MAG: L-serine ammonia-lyase [Acidobacteria bacterium]|nr:MAG: L-serine ammonia-lyase [Acidobacteriota bacterium]
MSNKENNKIDDKLGSAEKSCEVVGDDLLADISGLISKEVPSGVDRRSFLIRSAVGGAAAVMMGRTVSTQNAIAKALATMPVQGTPKPPLAADLNVVKKGQGPVMTLSDEFYKVGPGPSSSHTIGPMRITYDFYQRATKLPADKLAKATALKVHLFGSLSATGKGHGTERASLAGLVGKEPATVDPLFLDSLRDKPDQTFEVKLGSKSIPVTLKDIVYDATKGDFKHPNTMTCKLLAGTEVLLEQEYYSVGGGFIEWKGYTPPKKNAPKYPFRTMKELRAHADGNKLSIAKVILANETSISGRSEEEVYAFIDKIINAMVATVKSGLSMSEDDVLPGPIKLHSKAATVYKRAQDDKYATDKGIGSLAAFALAASEENARGHLVITAPTGGSAGVMPSLVYGLLEVRKLDRQKVRDGMLAALAIGYLCKHHATLSAAEGGCQAEIGVASSMAAALVATAYDAESNVVENAAESALEHHLGMTCDPVAGYVQVPCVERCAFGAVKAWTAYAIASNEIASRHRVDFDATVMALAETARDMNSKYKETSEAGLALSVVLC